MAGTNLWVPDMDCVSSTSSLALNIWLYRPGFLLLWLPHLSRWHSRAGSKRQLHIGFLYYITQLIRNVLLGYVFGGNVSNSHTVDLTLFQATLASFWISQTQVCPLNLSVFWGHAAVLPMVSLNSISWAYDEGQTFSVLFLSHRKWDSQIYLGQWHVSRYDTHHEQVEVFRNFGSFSSLLLSFSMREQHVPGRASPLVWVLEWENRWQSPSQPAVKRSWANLSHRWEPSRDKHPSSWPLAFT